MHFQILYGLDTLGETPREEHKITVCKLSRKKLVAYGCSNGMVKLFDFENGKSKLAMKLEKSVTYLDFLESEHKFALAAGDENSLKVRHFKISKIIKLQNVSRK